MHNAALHAVGAHAGNRPWDDGLHHVEQAYLDEGGEFLVGLLEGQIVAMGALKRSEAPGRVEIKRMRVDPAFQRRGFGRATLQRLQARARELGCHTLHPETAAGQLAAQGLYRAMGFVETGRGRMGRFELVFFEKRLDPTPAGPP